MNVSRSSRRDFLALAATSVSATAFVASTPSVSAGGAVPAGDKAGKLFAYVGTFSSPLKDMLPTQVDLPPGNGKGIHIFEVDRTSGDMRAIVEFPLGTSPSCLAINRAGTRMYSANETDRVGENREGTVSSFAIDRESGQLKLLNTVSSEGAGPTYVSVHPSGRFLLVANYF